MYTTVYGLLKLSVSICIPKRKEIGIKKKKKKLFTKTWRKTITTKSEHFTQIRYERRDFKSHVKQNIGGKKTNKPSWRFRWMDYLAPIAASLSYSRQLFRSTQLYRRTGLVRHDGAHYNILRGHAIIIIQSNL